ncbi:ATP-binding cassette domain-containing protein [Aliiroseovarius marinus]|uniref:ATP-binding cassette domain-containing protein n=1 Tax=Aliiroseovarius marinus TaxID=2500159 RepID=UPI003D7DE1CE
MSDPNAAQGKPLPTTISGATARRVSGGSANANPAPKKARRTVSVSTPKPAPKPPAAQPKARRKVMQVATPSPEKTDAAKVSAPKPRMKIKPKPKLVRPAANTPTQNLTAQERLQGRAQLIATYAGLLGHEAHAVDIAEAMVTRAESFGPDEAIGIDVIEAGVASTGLSSERILSGVPTPQIWPGLAMMQNGQVVLVEAQTADHVTLFEPGAREGRTEVPLADFAPHFTGVVLRAEASLNDLADRHATSRLADHWFWGELPKYKRYFMDVALGSFVANLLAVAVALFSLQVYDRVIPHQSSATLWVLAAGAFVAIMLEAGLKAARARLMDGAGRAIELNIQKLLMDRVLGMRSDKRPTSPSGLFSAMREFGSVREFFTASSVGALTDIPFIFLFLALVASIAGNVVWILIAGGILMVLPGYFLQKHMVRISQETQGASAKAARLLHEVIFEHDTVKSQRGEDRVRRLWTELTMLSAVKNSEQRRLSGWLTFWSQGVQQATYVSAVIMGTYLVFAGEFTVGSIIAVGILTGRTLSPLTQLSSTLARWSNVKSALDGLDTIAGSEQDEAEGRTYLRRETLSGNFELRELRFAYDEDAPGLDVPGLAIEPGQRLAVLGANGSGKSTLLKILSGLYAPQSGRVMIDGIDMSQIAPRDLRRNIGYLSQDVRLFAGTLRDNLNLSSLERDDDRLLQALDFAGLGPFVRGHSKGLDLEIRDAGEGLSIGQRQSIGWARIWLQDPKVVLLDEPTAALDQTLETTLVSRLESWLQGRTAIIATHRVPILKLTERTVIMQNGRLAVDGPRDQVLSHLKSAGQGAS